jgi:hypothetical protein
MANKLLRAKTDFSKAILNSPYVVFPSTRHLVAVSVKPNADGVDYVHSKTFLRLDNKGNNLRPFESFLFAASTWSSPSFSAVAHNLARLRKHSKITLPEGFFVTQGLYKVHTTDY